jgi:hypothetical protein
MSDAAERMRKLRRVLMAIVLVGCSDSSGRGTAVPIPGGHAGIGFDDLLYSAMLGRVLVPAGRTGALALLDPASDTLLASCATDMS